MDGRPERVADEMHNGTCDACTASAIGASPKLTSLLTEPCSGSIQARQRPLEERRRAASRSPGLQNGRFSDRQILRAPARSPPPPGRPGRNLARRRTAGARHGGCHPPPRTVPPGPNYAACAGTSDPAGCGAPTLDIDSRAQKAAPAIYAGPIRTQLLSRELPPIAPL